MKKILPLFVALILLSFCACKKAIQNKEQAILMDAITNGSWIVEQYYEDTLNETSDFDGYVFQFKGDGTVTGKVSVSDSAVGTWSGDISSQTITSDFPNSGDPYKKLNGTWKITDSYWDYVEAEMDVAGVMKSLHLRKR